MNNLFVKYPERGDVVLGDLTTKEVKFVKLSTYVDSEVDTTLYEKIGVVARRTGNEVLIVYKENASKVWCNRAWWYLGGYTLDGTDRSGVLSCRFPSNSYASNINKTIAYNATTMEDFVAQLNEAFLADTDFVALDYYADITEDGKVRVHCDNKDYRQCTSNVANTGFAYLTATGAETTGAAALPEVIAQANIRRVHGGTGGEGAISSWYRALAYYRNDNGTNSYQGGRTTVQTSVKQSYPINLPTWLGTSEKNPGDFCAALRAIYGEGEEGWLAFMKTCLPVCPTDYGNMGMRNGLERTKVQALQTYVSNKVTTKTSCCAAADYCYKKEMTCIPQGNWYLPTVEDVHYILNDVQYGTNSSRTADALNEALYKIGGSAVSNGSSYWSCLRFGTHYAWFAYGGYGFFGNNALYGSYVCVPVSLHTIA